MAYPQIINENASRLNAFFTLVLSAILAAFPAQDYDFSIIVLAYLTLGFFLRSVISPQYDPTAIFSQKVILRLLGITEKPTNAMPKRFAQAIGLSFCLLGFFFFFTKNKLAFQILFIVLSCFAFLEAAFNFCAGCFIFNQMLRLRLLPKSICEECENISQRIAQKTQK